VAVENRQDVDAEVRETIREIVADVLELDLDRVGWDSHFWDELGADSLQGIEILSALERRFGITIEQSSLVAMRDVRSTHAVVVAALNGARHDAG
jgi:acyl carrier protein